MGRERFVNIDRETPMILPVDMRDWVRDDDLAHFILEVVGGVDTRHARVNARGTGDLQYPPTMMLAVLIYCYASGVFGSRRIELQTHRNVSVRYLAGNTHPDHDSICKFRRENEALIKEAFAEVLRVAGALNLKRVGTVCLDGTKILANAAKRRTYGEKELKEAQQRLDIAVEELLKKAEAADAESDQETGELPEQLQGKKRLREQVREAQAALREYAQDQAEQREADRAEWKKERIGDCPRKRQPEPGPSDRINLTDPQSALMPLPNGQYAQAYNAQLAVTAEGPTLIVAAEVCAQTNDRQQLQPMAEAIAANCGEELERLVTDCGFDNPRQVHAVETQLGIEVICPPQRTCAQSPSRYRQTVHRKRTQAIRSRMKERTQSPEGQSWLHQRRTTVEPSFGILKEALGFQRFRLRGLQKVNIEWKLASVAFNCLRICRARRNKNAQDA